MLTGVCACAISLFFSSQSIAKPTLTHAIQKKVGCVCALTSVAIVRFPPPISHGVNTRGAACLKRKKNKNNNPQLHHLVVIRLWAARDKQTN